MIPLLSLYLEVELERELHYSATVLIHDLTKIINSGLIVMEALGWISGVTVHDPSSSIRYIRNGHIADRVERQVDVTCTQAAGRADLCWICLVEYVE